ncbi:putative Meiotic coiled-coil protein 7 [Glarea lozoyensis 74030]|uniref:Putative Meiotic coiled-coil protein 7 n=1 Tax=Glarea lozoyensis (strain ATCC 74030 / MF5533) TaxID=1104152 RepID=H0EM16_GLAL7|nr:putative Meiotic coiled-coil protein 7 [Glarea lozoyensis 74030]
MPPKILPPAAKQSKILDFFRTTTSVYTLRELEKCLPGVAGINGMQVKEYLQALSDENLIRVEKIGSGNWYWCFVSEERKRREGVLKGLKNEKGGLEERIVALEGEVEVEEGRRGVDGERKELLESYSIESLLEPQK